LTSPDRPERVRIVLGGQSGGVMGFGVEFGRSTW
jgi:hypothetical protein